MHKVLIITPFYLPNIGGAETYVYELTEYLRTHDFQVNVLTYQPITTPNVKGLYLEKKENITIRRFQWIGFNLFRKLEKTPFINFLYLTPYLLIRSILWMLIHHREVEIIDAQGFNSACIAFVLKKLFNKKAIVSVMSLYDFVPGSLLANCVKLVISGMDHVITESEVSKKELMGIGVRADKLTPYVEWLDQNVFKPYDKLEMKKKFGFPEKFTVLFVGRAIEIKGIDLIIGAAKKLKEYPISFVFISNAGPLTSLLESVAKENTNVIFIPGVPYSELSKYESAADLAVVPSRYSENSAITVLTAICSGTPVVASDIGAIPALVTEDVAVLVKPTIEDFADAILKLYEHKDAYTKLLGNCIPYANAHFSINNASTISNTYLKVIAGELRA